MQTAKNVFLWPRPCEKTIAANYWAIYGRCAGLRHGEDFGYAIPRAIELLVFVRVVTFYTASPLTGHSSSRIKHGVSTSLRSALTIGWDTVVIRSTRMGWIGISVSPLKPSQWSRAPAESQSGLTGRPARIGHQM